MPDPFPLPEPSEDHVSDDPGSALPDEDLEAVRELVLRAHPDVVPELVCGASVAGLLASVEPARSAYARLAQALADAAPPPVPVPAGGGTPFTIDPEKIPAAEKIRRGLKAATYRAGQEG